MNQILQNYKMSVNENKIKILFCGKAITQRTKIKINNIVIEEIGILCYVGRKIIKDSKSNEEIVTRIGQAKAAFFKKKNPLISRNISIHKRKLLKTFV